MHSHHKAHPEETETPFIKGMTLEQYMASPIFQSHHQEQQEQLPDQNLYESSLQPIKETPHSKKKQYRIDQIDQESFEDSKDYHHIDQDRETPNFDQKLLPQPENIEYNEGAATTKGRANSISMSTAITLKHNPDPNTFRIKHASISPQKKKPSMPFPNGSITLYGAKFNQKPQKQSNKMPEMLTFYGKLHFEGEQLLTRKSSIKQSDLKQKFKKKNHYQLTKMLQFQSPTKYNPPTKHNYPEFCVQGHRDYPSDRKPRHF